MDIMDDIMENKTEINEGLVEVLFKTFRSSIQVRDMGTIVEFKLMFTETKTFFSLKVRKNTLKDFRDWFEKIYKEVE